jgi:type I restriction enzyme S subunit
LVDQREFFNRRVAASNIDHYYHLKKGEFAYNRSAMNGYPFGAIKRLDAHEEGALSTLYICFAPKSDSEIDSNFASFLFDSGQLNDDLGSICAVGARAHGLLNVTPSDFFEVSFLLPPLPEQRKIAAILSSVDEAISATRKVIEQTERVKQGLLQTLMTRGIGHTRFKQTEIGEIPEVWEVTLLDEVAQRGSGHTPNRKRPEYWDGEIRWVSLADSAALDRVYISETDKTLTPAGIANSSAVLHPRGTVLVSRDASVGRSAIATRDLAVSQHFIAWRCSPRLHNHFLYYWLQQQKALFERMAVGSTIKTIGLAFFRALKIPVPPLSEQERIVDALLGHERAVWSHEAGLARLETLKRGLVQDLLTGRVRVQPD